MHGSPLQPQAAGYLGEHERPVLVRHREASGEYAVDTSACLIVAALQTMKISPAGCRGSSAEVQLTPLLIWLSQ